MNPQTAIHNLARKASGIGIVCGLDLIVDARCTLKVTQGYGITSKGFFIHIPESKFLYCKPYHGTVKGLFVETAQVEVWEALEAYPDAPEDSTEIIPLTPQEIGADWFLEGKVFFLYLENVKKGRVKPLLMDREELWKLLDAYRNLDLECLPNAVEPDDTVLFDYNEDEFPNGRQLFCAINRNTSLQPIHLMRFGFATTDKECDPSEREFRLNSQDFEGLFEEYHLIISDVVEQLENRKNILHAEAFHDLFPKQQRDYFDLYFDYLKGNRWSSFKSEPRNTYVQYFYDFTNDLVSTYNELIKEIARLIADCCPEKGLFPRHLLLGEIQEDIGFGPSVFRNHFRQPPIYNGNQVRIQKIRFLHWRMVMQIKNFYIPHVESTELAEAHYTQIEKNNEPPQLLNEIPEHALEDIKITPDKLPCCSLSSQTIPFYYYVNDDLNSMHHFWDFEAVYRCKTQHLLSYHAEQEDSYTNLCAVKNPLAHHFDVPAFFKIEGVIGQQTNPAKGDDDRLMRELNDLKCRFNLGFEVLRLSFNEFFDDYDTDGDFQIHPSYLGAEHLRGTGTFGTYILLCKENSTGSSDAKVVADFWVNTQAPPPQPEKEETRLIKGEIIDNCRNIHNFETTLTFESEGGATTTVDVKADGKFTTNLLPGDYKLEFATATNFYLISPEINIPSTYKEEFPLVCTVSPYRKLTVKLKPYASRQEKVQLYISGETKEKVAKNTTVFKGLKAGEYKVRWMTRSGVQIVEKEVKLDSCKKNYQIILNKNRVFPPDKEDGAWDGFKGLPEKRVDDLIGKYKVTWDQRGPKIDESLENSAQVVRNKITPIIDPFLYDFTLSKSAMDLKFKNFLEVINANADAFQAESRKELAKTVTAMYLERMAIVEKEFDPEVNHRLAKLVEFQILDQSELEAFIREWKNNISGFTNPSYETQLKASEILKEIARPTLDKGLAKDRILGMGNKALGWLKANQVDTFQKLADMPVRDLKVIMERSETLKNLDVSSWPKQAKLILEGKDEELADLHDQLRNP